jgi:hypothetical protein
MNFKEYLCLLLKLTGPQLRLDIVATTPSPISQPGGNYNSSGVVYGTKGTFQDQEVSSKEPRKDIL